MKQLFYIILFIHSIVCFGYDWPHEVSDLKPDPRIVYGKLDNGFRYVFMPNDQLPKHFAVRLRVRAGSLMEEEEERGLAHFLEHMAFKGIKGYPEDEMIRTLQHLGVPFGTHNNAYTDVDETVYQLDFMNNTLENLEHGLKIMAGIADGMLLDEALIIKERDVISAEKRDSYDVGYKWYCDFSEFVYKGLRINDRMPIGLESVIKSANSTLLRNFYKKWYRPERMVLVIVGDLDQHEVEGRIREYFSNFSDLLEAPKEPNLGMIKYNQELKSRIYKDKELSETAIEFNSLKSYQKKVIDREGQKEAIYEAIAYRIFNNRLAVLAKQDDFPFRTASASTYTAYDLLTSSYISIKCEPDQVLGAITIMENELRRVFEYGFTDEEFDRIKRETLHTYKNNLVFDETSKTSGLIETLLKTITDENVFTAYKEDYEIAKELLENEANKDECLRIFKNSWDTRNLSLYLSTNSDLKYTEAQLTEAYSKSQKIVLEAPEERKIVSYHFKGLSEPGTVLKEEYNEELDCYYYKFSNNIRVNLKQTNFDKNQIFYRINFGNGEDEPGDRPEGIEDMASDILYNGGVGELSKEELLRAFAGSGVGIPYIGVEEGAFTISSSVEADDFEAQMNLICGCLMEPAYRSDELKQRHLNIADYYKNLNQTIDGIMSSEVLPYLTNGHDDHVLWPMETLIARTHEEVKNWMTDALRQAYMEVTIVGDFNRDEVVEALSKTLGALPERKDHKQCYELNDTVALRKAPLKRVFGYHSTLPQAESIVYWELPGYENDDDQWRINQARATVIVEILGERLRQVVRMELGEGYSLYTEFNFRLNAIAASTITNPEKANYLCELIVEIAGGIALEGATKDEFDRVMLPKLLDMESNKFTNWYWLDRLAWSQEYAHLREDADFMNEYYKKITLEEINEAAKEYLKAEKALKIMVVPDRHRKKVEEIAGIKNSPVSIFMDKIGEFLKGLLAA